MQTSTLSANYRPIPWPGAAIPEPEIAKLKVLRTDGPWIYLRQAIRVRGGVQEPVRMTLPENALEQKISRVDVTDFNEVLALVELLGGDLVPVRRNRVRDYLTPELGMIPIDRREEYAQHVSNASEALGWDEVSAQDLYWFDPSTPRQWRVHIAEVSERIWALQLALRGISRTTPLTNDLHWDTQFPELPEVIPVRWLRGVMANNLSAFTPGIAFEAIGKSLKQLDESSVETFYEVTLCGSPTALEVAALQLYNTVVRKEEFKICKNCGSVFSSHVDRAETDRRFRRGRSDAQSCSKSCSRTYSYRQAAARKKAEAVEAGGAPKPSKSRKKAVAKK